MIEVDAVNRKDALLLLSNGRTVPVTNWFDITGEECEPFDAVTAVGGSDNQWFSVILSYFEPETTH
jgi:hypothetical protein